MAQEAHRSPAVHGMMPGSTVWWNLLQWDDPDGWLKLNKKEAGNLGTLIWSTSLDDGHNES